jgi:hypothetical protein
MADTTMPAMVAPGVCDRQRLQNPADRLARLGLQEEMEVVSHQRVAVEPKGIAELGLSQRVQEGAKVAVGDKDTVAVIAAVESVVD